MGCVPSSLVFTVSALYNFVFSGKYFLLEYLCPSALFYTRDLEDLCRIHIRVTASAHDRDATDHALVDLLIGMKRVQGKDRPRQTCTDEYTALYILTGGCWTGCMKASWSSDATRTDARRISWNPWETRSGYKLKAHWYTNQMECS